MLHDLLSAAKSARDSQDIVIELIEELIEARDEAVADRNRLADEVELLKMELDK